MNLVVAALVGLTVGYWLFLKTASALLKFLLLQS